MHIYPSGFQPVAPLPASLPPPSVALLEEGGSSVGLSEGSEEGGSGVGSVGVSGVGVGVVSMGSSVEPGVGSAEAPGVGSALSVGPGDTLGPVVASGEVEGLKEASGDTLGEGEGDTAGPAMWSLPPLHRPGRLLLSYQP